VLDAPETKIAQIINGDLYLSPRPGGPATAVATNVIAELVGPFGRGRGGPGGWVILFEPELHVHDDVLVPDAGGWRVERLPTVPEGAAFTVHPDWVCEVLSKSTERIDRREKMAIYAAMGVGHVWLAHPRNRTVEAFRRQGDQWLLLGVYVPGIAARIEPFDQIEIDVAEFWRHTAPPTRASEAGADYEYADW
jgi:Uma2 family endonuclease